MKTLLALLILTAGISSLAAQTQDRERPERPQRPDSAQVFKTADTNEDGFLDLKELTAFRENMPVGRGRGGRGGPPAANADNNAPAPKPAEGQRERGGRGMPTAEDMLAQMDKNEDGKIAPDEFTMGNRRGRGGQGGPAGGEGRRSRPPE
ncbi:hypothetical protein N9C83_03790 [Opitutales bacterium]|nr:hypothetical protein [Opitutales bacterium]